MASSKATVTDGCPVAAFQKMISGKYKLRIVWDLKDGPLRCGQIRSGLLRGSDGTREIAPRVLSRELKALTQTGLIDRKDYGVVPPKVEYRLIAAGLLQPGSGVLLDVLPVDAPDDVASNREILDALGEDRLP